MKPDFSPVASFIEETVLGAHGVPGCDILVQKDHKVLFRHTCGLADRESGTPLAKDQLYQLYSCTKPVTVTAAIRLVEEGRLELDAPVGDYLPAFKDVHLLRNGVRVPPAKAPTVRNLFTMTAGFDYDLHAPATDELLRRNPHATTREVVDSFAAKPLGFEPGDRFQYSLCHDILAAVVEEVAGMRFSDYLDHMMFKPLGMADSGFKTSPGIHARLAAQYLWKDGKMVLTDGTNAYRRSDRWDSGGAGLVSSVADYAAFADALACRGDAANGYRLLKPETVRLLRTEQLSACAMNPAFSCAAGPGYGYGLGVRTRIDQKEGQKSPIGEFGWDGASGFYTLMDPVNRLSIVVGMQVLNWPACIGSAHAVLRDLVYTALFDA